MGHLSSLMFEIWYNDFFIDFIIYFTLLKPEYIALILLRYFKLTVYWFKVQFLNIWGVLDYLRSSIIILNLWTRIFRFGYFGGVTVLERVNGVAYILIILILIKFRHYASVTLLSFLVKACLTFWLAVYLLHILLSL